MLVKFYRKGVAGRDAFFGVQLLFTIKANNPTD